MEHVKDRIASESLQQITTRPEKRETQQASNRSVRVTRRSRQAANSSTGQRRHHKLYYIWYFANTIWAILAFPMGVSVIAFVRNHRKQNAHETTASLPFAFTAIPTHRAAADAGSLLNAVQEGAGVRDDEKCLKRKSHVDDTWKPPFVDQIEEYPYVQPAQKPVFCIFNHSSYQRPEDWAFRTGLINGHMCTHVVYASAKITNDELDSANPIFDIVKDGFKNLALLKFKYPHLKVLVSFGEYEKDTANLSVLASSEARRATFARNVLAWLVENDYDGVNINWMHPSGPCGSPEDGNNLVKMIEQLRAVISRNRTVALTVPSSKALRRDGYDLRLLEPSVDYFIVQTHDLHSSGSNMTHCACPYMSDDRSLSSVLTDVLKELPSTFDSERVCFSITFSGTSFRLAATPSVRLSELAKRTVGAGSHGTITRTKGRLAFYEACRLQGPDPFMDFRELCSYKTQGRDWVGYETPVSLSSKLSEVFRRFKTQCVAVWDMDMDDFKGVCGLGKVPLLRAVYEEVAAVGQPYQS